MMKSIGGQAALALQSPASAKAGQNMANHRILVLADDLTGAIEVGAKFAGAGVSAQVRTLPGLMPRDLLDATGALVVDTETRHAGPAEAARRVYELARAARSLGFSYVYKKTDSTLRGNIGAELAALIEAYAGSPLIYVPAYPQLGRTVRNGSLYVDGVLVGATCFSGDPLNPVKESHIPTLLAGQCRFPIRSGPVAILVDSQPPCIAVCDGETDGDVEAAARAFIDSSILQLAAGPAGLAAHLARLVEVPRATPPPLPRVRNALIVNGSLHPRSLRQVEQAKQEGFRSVDIRSIPNAPADGGWLIMEQGSGASGATLDFAKSLAWSVRRFLERSPIDLLVVFGGDTAYAIVEAIGNPPLYPLGEVMEGIPISRVKSTPLGPYAGHGDRGLYVVTKAGSFGPPGVLASLRNALG
jgi:uncharacterized protein YgbK (DUF1537 family)